jgi:hypothetical protein
VRLSEDWTQLICQPIQSPNNRRNTIETLPIAEITDVLEGSCKLSGIIRLHYLELLMIVQKHNNRCHLQLFMTAQSTNFWRQINKLEMNGWLLCRLLVQCVVTLSLDRSKVMQTMLLEVSAAEMYRNNRI